MPRIPDKLVRFPWRLALLALAASLMTQQALAAEPESTSASESVTAAGADVEAAPAQAAEVDSVPESTHRRLVRIERIEGDAAGFQPQSIRVVRDKETGELRAPTAEEAKAFAASLDPLNRSDAGLVEKHYSDGTVALHLQGRFQNVMVVRRDGDQLHAKCTHDAHTAHELMHSEVVTEEVRDVR